MKKQEQRDNRNTRFILSVARSISYLCIFISLTMIPMQGHGWQGKGGSEEIDIHLAKLTQELNLSPGQEEAARAILEEVAERRQEVLAKYNLDQETMQALMNEMREMRITTSEWLAEVLNEEQRTKFQRMRQERFKGQRE